MPTPQNKILIIGASGALFSIITDYCGLLYGKAPSLESAANIFSSHFAKTYQWQSHHTFEVTIILGMLLVLGGILLCMKEQPQTPTDAFIRGGTIMAVLFIAKPTPANTGGDVVKEDATKSTTQTIAPAQNDSTQHTSLFISSAMAENSFHSLPPLTIQNDQPIYYSPNASLAKQTEWISTTQPSEGFLSTITNKISINDSGDNLPPDTKIQVLFGDGNYFQTSGREYYYIKIQYKINDQVKQGWIFTDGTNSNPDEWGNIRFTNNFNSSLKYYYNKQK